ncbi:hypothetical protein JYU34_013543 [Plutella xylostella]|uniref:Myofilin n=1 Tax=Plutella xylostella TaxID=51655 RepID=A0ABQ7QA41_PLUXY|nr:hypothetical protein JYU34_013543 [Plutella xylostella]
MFKNHLEMIGRNETASKKARFWQSYVRSLKGSEDIRAEERYRPTRRSVFPELTSSSWPYNKSIYDEPAVAADRINVPGYRYLPVHRETYGYSPRNIYTHNYPRTLDRYRPIYHVPRRVLSRADPFDAHKAWQEHLDRMSAIDRLYPSRYGLYLKDRAYPITDLSAPSNPIEKSLKGIEYEPDNKPHWGAGAPLYTAGGLRRRPWADIFNPSPSLPISAITRDPFWYDWPELRPVARWDRSPSHIRDSYLSPVKRTFLWDKHPVRPLAAAF